MQADKHNPASSLSAHSNPNNFTSIQPANRATSEAVSGVGKGLKSGRDTASD